MNSFFDEVSSPQSAVQPQTSNAVFFDGAMRRIGEHFTVVGRLSTVRVLSTGWGFGMVKDSDGRSMSVSGNALGGLEKGATYEFSGRLSANGSYGPQLKLDSAGLHIPASREGLLSFLQKNYKGLGKKTAEMVVAYFDGNGGLGPFRDKLLADPLGFDFSAVGVKRKVSMKAVDGVKGMIYMDLCSKLGGFDIGDKLLRKIAAYLEEKVVDKDSPVQKAWTIMTSNPYAPIRDLAGYSFKTADRFARLVKFDFARDERIAALVTHALSEGCSVSGHTYLLESDFAKVIHDIDPTIDVARAINVAVQNDEPLVIEDGRHYPEPIAEAEVSLVKNLVWRETRPVSNSIYSGGVSDLELEISQVEEKISALKNIKFRLDESQRDALLGVLTSGSSTHVLTAGPGAGKTSVVEVVVEILRGKKKLIHKDGAFEEVPYEIGFCAPTGKAAKVLSARVSRFGLAAQTIHSMLGVKGDGMGAFEHNRFNKLAFDLLVVDETSMVDLPLLAALVDAVTDTAHIIFLGDDKQLPSVGPGSCLKDLMALPFDGHRLNKTHRNDGGILEVVNLAGEGMVDFRHRPDVDFVPKLPEASEAGVGSILNLYDQSLARCGGDFKRVGLLCARRKGEASTPGWNITYLNAVLRERYNPESVRRISKVADGEFMNAGKGEKVFGTKYRVNDRIIIRKNLVLKDEDDPDVSEQVVNGDTGVILDYSMSHGDLHRVEIRLDDDRNVLLPAGDVDTLDLAYAMTVHASQGSEYEHVFFICVNGSASFVHRGIAFTAFSRAKKHLMVIGEAEVVKQVVERPMPRRNSYLVQRFRKELAIYDKKRAMF